MRVPAVFAHKCRGQVLALGLLYNALLAAASPAGAFMQEASKAVALNAIAQLMTVECTHGILCARTSWSGKLRIQNLNGNVIHKYAAYNLARHTWTAVAAKRASWRGHLQPFWIHGCGFSYIPTWVWLSSPLLPGVSACLHLQSKAVIRHAMHITDCWKQCFMAHTTQRSSRSKMLQTSQLPEGPIDFAPKVPYL